MKNKVLNREHVEGRVYEHNLVIKTVQNTESANYGKEFIGGTLDIATDEEGLNIVQINFTYVTPTTSTGKNNVTYATLKDIIDNGKTWLLDGKDNATVVKVDTALGLNEFYTDRDGEEKLVAAKRNEGGFVTKISANQLNAKEAERNKFEFDMLINGTRLVEADPEKNIDNDYLIVKGAVFNFRNDLLPVELVVRNKGGINYFESLDASNSNPVFTKVWGVITSTTVVKTYEEESGFGESLVKESVRNIKEWVITGTAKETYEFGNAEEGITIEDIKSATEKMNIRRADIKKRSDEYKASKVASQPASAGGFDF